MFSSLLFYFCIAATALRWNAHALINPTFATTGTTTALQTRGGSPLFNAPQHGVNGQKAMESLAPDQQERLKAFLGHQENVPKIGFAADVRSLIQYNHGFAVISTNSKSNPGFPGGSVIGFAVDDDGRPIFLFSGMSGHTTDILKDPRCSLTIADKNFKGAADGRVNLMGNCNRVKDPDEIEEVREMYMKKHPGAFWANFGDFFFYRMEIEAIRFVGGFARAGAVTPEDYKEASPDPIVPFGGAIADHMNDDHMSSTLAMVKHYIPSLGGDNYVQEALINRVDSLGMDIKISVDPEDNDTLPGQPKQFKVRLPFPEPVTERAAVKTAIVQMTQASARAPAETEVAK